jgi:hypothetical protein
MALFASTSFYDALYPDSDTRVAGVNFRGSKGHFGEDFGKGDLVRV